MCTEFIKYGVERVMSHFPLTYSVATARLKAAADGSLSRSIDILGDTPVESVISQLLCDL
jgi:hypothetical protein